VELAFARLNGEQIIEIHTGNNMPPSLTNYSERGRINDSGRRLRRVRYRWNGRFLPY
jgi:hypothetical protein